MTRCRAFSATAAAVCLAASLASTAASAQSGEVNVYTYRETKLIQPLFDAFTKDTGIKDDLKRGWARKTRLQVHEEAREKTPGLYPDMTPQLAGKYAK